MTIIDLSLPRRVVQKTPFLFSYIKSKRYYVPAKLITLNLLTSNLDSKGLDGYLNSSIFALIESLKSMNYYKIKAMKEFF
ncbi:MAG: hypothetical protein AB2417_03830 [Clostridiaceae bacterium]